MNRLKKSDGVISPVKQNSDDALEDNNVFIHRFSLPTFSKRECRELFKILERELRYDPSAIIGSPSKRK
jgi:hypothetical protein